MTVVLRPARLRAASWFAMFATATLLAVSSSFCPSAWAQDTTPAPATATVITPAMSEKVDADVMARIRDEGMNRSQVMPTLAYLSDVIGPRLTGSASLKRANEWTKTKLAGWGLQNAHLEAWGPFGRSWELQRFSAQVTEPMDIPLIALPKAWSPSLSGTLNAEVVALAAKTEDELTPYKGKLRGKIVLVSPMSDVVAHFDPQGTRYSDKDLTDMAQATAPAAGRPGNNLRPQLPRTFATAQRFGQARLRFLVDEGAALMVESGRGDGGTIFVQQVTVPQPPPPTSAPADAPPSFRNRVSPWQNPSPKDIIPQVVVAVEQYNRLLRMLQAGEKVKMEVALSTKFTDHDKDMVFNTVAEIPGSDKASEVVMCGGHMDSWHGGTGATDNGAGCAVAMEAVRILQTLGLKPRRTIRVALWSGEEQGLFGSHAYVEQHFGTREKPTKENEQLSAYYNLDNGTGKIRGVYCQGNEAVRPIFAAWLMPFADLGASTLTIRNTGGTDHLSFDAVGIPGFQFIQDTIEYGTRTHHSNADVFDRIQGDDLKQAAVIMAAFLYNTAMRDELMPRKPAPPVTTAATAAR